MKTSTITWHEPARANGPRAGQGDGSRRSPTLGRCRAALAIAAAIAAASPPALAAGTDLLTLTREALLADPAYTSAQFAQTATTEAVPQARANLLPNLSASVSESATRLDFRSSNEAIYPNYQKTFNAWGPALNLTIPIYNAPLWEGLSEAKLLVKQGEAQLAQAHTELLLRVARAYFDVLASQDTLTALVENKNAAAEQLTRAKREFELGNKTIVDSHEAQARYDQIDALEDLARSDLEVKQSALAAIVGHEVGTLLAPGDSLRLNQPLPADVKAWSRSAEEGNYSVLAARAGNEIAHHEVQRARDAYRPTVDFAASMQYQRSDNGSEFIPVNNNVTGSTVGVTLTVPVFSGGATQSRLREAHAREDKAEQDLELARRTAVQAARQAFSSTVHGLAQVAALETAETSARTQLESTRRGYQVGVRINLDVLNANLQLFNTRRDLKKARYDVLVNGLALKAAAGTLHEEDIESVNVLLHR